VGSPSSRTPGSAQSQSQDILLLGNGTPFTPGAATTGAATTGAGAGAGAGGASPWGAASMSTPSAAAASASAAAAAGALREAQSKLQHAEEEKRRLQERIGRFEEVEQLLNDSLDKVRKEATAAHLEAAQGTSEARFQRERADRYRYLFLPYPTLPCTALHCTVPLFACFVCYCGELCVFMIAVVVLNKKYLCPTWYTSVVVVYLYLYLYLPMMPPNVFSVTYIDWRRPCKAPSRRVPAPCSVAWRLSAP
jgi:hypothetical protein